MKIMSHTLFQRLVNASGPDRELDAQIAEWRGEKVTRMPVTGPHLDRDGSPVAHFTESVDAAYDLAEGWYVHLRDMADGGGHVADLKQLKQCRSDGPEGLVMMHQAPGSNRALALCAAAVKARGGLVQS